MLNLLSGDLGRYLDAQPFFPRQDTVVALKALSEFAALMNTERTDVTVTVTGPSSPRPVKFLIDAQNRFLLRTAEVWTRAWFSQVLGGGALALEILPSSHPAALCQGRSQDPGERRAEAPCLVDVLSWGGGQRGDPGRCREGGAPGTPRGRRSGPR